MLPSNTYRITILSCRGCFPGKEMDASARLIARRCLWSVIVVLLALGASLCGPPLLAQDWIKTGTGLGVEKVRLAVPDFKSNSNDPQGATLLKTFNDTLWNDLDNSG